jgi:hypothetical protein
VVSEAVAVALGVLDVEVALAVPVRKVQGVPGVLRSRLTIKRPAAVAADAATSSRPRR